MVKQATKFGPSMMLYTDTVLRDMLTECLHDAGMTDFCCVWVLCMVVLMAAPHIVVPAFIVRCSAVHCA